MKKIVIDSNIFMKIFLNEEYRDKALNLFEYLANNQTQILVPRLFYYEVFGIAKKRGVDCNLLMKVYEKYEESLLSYIIEDKEITKKALKITEQGNEKSGYPSIYDSTYHAIAILNNCDFITADKRHYEKTKQLGNIKLLSDIKI